MFTTVKYDIEASYISSQSLILPIGVKATTPFQKGEIIYDSADNKLYYSDGKSWLVIAASTEPPPTGGLNPSGTVPMTGNLNVNNNKVINVGTPTDSGDGVPKSYVDNTFVKKTGDLMTGTLDMGLNKVISNHNPIDLTDLVKKSYVDRSWKYFIAKTNTNSPIIQANWQTNRDLYGWSTFLTNTAIPSENGNAAYALMERSPT